MTTRTIFACLCILVASSPAAMVDGFAAQAATQYSDEASLPHTAQSSLMRLCADMSRRAAWAQDWQCLAVAVFDNGSEVVPISDLRSKTDRTEEEEALLRAVAKTGNIHLCSRRAGNAFLIMYEGRPAVITSAHLFTERDSNSLACSEEDTRPLYYPDVSYYDANDPEENRALYTRSVELEFPPENFEDGLAGLQVRSNDESFNDYVIFYLKEDITRDIMPSGHQRSYFRPSADIPLNGKGLIAIGSGLDPDNPKAETYYHAGCNFTRTDDGQRINHDCNSIPGASGSVLGLMENGEVTFAGLIQGARIGGDVSLPGSSWIYEPNWNYGVSSSVVYPK